MQDDKQMHSGQKWKLPPNGQPICLFSGNPTQTRTIIRPDDDSKFAFIFFCMYCIYTQHHYVALISKKFIIAFLNF